MTLYEIQDNIRQAIEQGFNEETGEIFNASDLEALQIQRDEKIENIGCYIKDLEADIDAFKKEEESLAERRKAKERKLDSLKQFLTDAMIRNNKTKFETAKVRLGFRKSESIEVDENIKLDDKYYITKVQQTVDKKFLKEELKSGVVIDGVKLIEKQNLQVK